jgi:beta-glucanase (GH16 family)
MYKFFREVFMRIIIVLLSLLLSTTSAAPPPGYSLVWSDEFNGTTLDTNTWSYDTGLHSNVDYQAYTNHNVTIENAAAVLWVKHERYVSRYGIYNYTSSWIHTMTKKEFQYGYIEVRLKAMFGSGPWAAFWTMGANYPTVFWPKCGEIEVYDQKTGPRNFSTDPGDSGYVVSCDFASASGGVLFNTGRYDYTECLCSNYHMYAIEWDSLGIRYFFDGNKVWEYDTVNANNTFSSFHQPHYFNINVSVHAPFDTTIFPQKMYIDYVRVYQKSTQVKAIPQKSASKIFILSNPSQVQLKVYDLQGRLIGDYTDRARNMKPGGNVMKNIPSNLPIGIYIVRLFDGRKTASERLVIQK